MLTPSRVITHLLSIVNLTTLPPLPLRERGKG